MRKVAFARVDAPPHRKPPAVAQYNWITARYESPPEQLDLPLPPVDDTVLPSGDTVTLLATENGSQLLVSGFDLFLGKKSERVESTKAKPSTRSPLPPLAGSHRRLCRRQPFERP